MTEREVFEHWAKGVGINLTRSMHKKDEYGFPVAHHAWAAWQERAKYEQPFDKEEE